MIRGFDSHWFYGKKGYGSALLQDHKVREFIKGRIAKGVISRVEIERAANRVKVTIYTSRPGAIIGKGGKGIDDLSAALNAMVRRFDHLMSVQVNVTEVRQPELDAQLVAENIAVQLEKRISHRRAMRQALTRVARMNGRGIKINVGGRLGGSEIARSESDKLGKIPLHTLRADIDYGFATADTIYGSVGVKVWIYRGEILPERRLAEAVAAPAKEAEIPEAAPIAAGTVVEAPEPVVPQEPIVAPEPEIPVTVVETAKTETEVSANVDA